MRPKPVLQLSVVAILSVGAGATVLALRSYASAPSPENGQKGCELVRDDFGPRGKVPIRVETVVSGLVVPWGIAFLPHGEMIVSERPGRLQLVRGRFAEIIAADIPVTRDGESGLMGIALHPEYPAQRFLFLYYTTQKEGRKVNRVHRYRLAPDLRSAEPDRVIVDDIPAGVYHDGGRLRFGADGMLYIGTGDAREPSSSQAEGTLAGKLLRVTAEGEVPAGNPVSGSPVFLRGIRNTQGFDWLTPETLVVTDHGPSGELGRTGGDEVTFARAGANLGWPNIWGCAQREGMLAPALVWSDAMPPGGAALYRGDKIPAWKGSLLVGTLRSKHLHRVAIDEKEPRVVGHEVYLEGDPPAGFGRLREVVEGPDGYLYVTTSNCDGRGECAAAQDSLLRVTAE